MKFFFNAFKLLIGASCKCIIYGNGQSKLRKFECLSETLLCRVLGCWT